MSTTLKPLNFLFAENEDWLKRLDFYKGETKILADRLKDAASLLQGSPAMAKVEHFQNQFIIQREQIDEIAHDVRDHQNYIENRVKENPTASDHRSLNDHPKLRDRVLTFEKLYNDMRKEFYQFIAGELN
jgi:hypothetical protein